MYDKKGHEFQNSDYKYSFRVVLHLTTRLRIASMLHVIYIHQHTSISIVLSTSYIKQTLGILIVIMGADKWDSILNTKLKVWLLRTCITKTNSREPFRFFRLLQINIVNDTYVLFTKSKHQSFLPTLFSGICFTNEQWVFNNKRNLADFFQYTKYFFRISYT